MKLAFLLDVGTAVGGGGYALYMFAEYLARRNHEVHVFGINKNNVFLKGRELPDTIHLLNRFYFPRKFKGAGRIDNFFEKIFYERTVKRYMKNKGFDYVVGSLRTSALHANYLAKKLKIKSVNFVYESPPWMEHDLGKRWFMEYQGKFKESWEKTKKTYLQSDILISNSKLSQNWCDKWLEKKKVNGYVYPGIELDYADRIQIKSKKNQIVYVGRLHRYKNLDLIIKALQKIDDAPTLFIGGRGSEEDYLKDLAKKLNVVVVFSGWISDKEKWKVLKESLFAVFPSSHEGFGMPPMEALACQIPCICSDKEIFKEVYGDNVEYFKEGNVKDLRKKINLLLKDKKYREERGKQGRNYIEKKFSWEKSAEKIEEILNST